jgi:hypothetical protein
MRVDEAGHEIESARIDTLIGVDVLSRLQEAGDLAVFNGDCGCKGSLTWDYSGAVHDDGIELGHSEFSEGL